MTPPRLRIALVVPGRFHAFDLATALSNLGHDVTVFTNYPAWAAARFGVHRVRSLWLHGVAVRVLPRLFPVRQPEWLEALLHRCFGAWAARAVTRESWDFVHVWSGVAEELLRAKVSARVSLARGSAHIRAQGRLLEEEEARCGRKVDRPSAWMIRREEREYALAQRIVVPSRFAEESFVNEGIDPSKLRMLPLGVTSGDFRPEPSVMRARAGRVRGGEPLRVLYVGNLSFQKGMTDLAAIARALPREKFRFRLVGPLADAASLFRDMPEHVEVAGKVSQSRLASHYAWADLFLFPTIQDGFATVLCQAQAAGLPILATWNCGARELIARDKSGWLLPIRSPEKFVERLEWCEMHRAELAAMAEAAYGQRVRGWEDVARDFLRLRPVGGRA